MEQLFTMLSSNQWAFVLFDRSTIQQLICSGRTGNHEKIQLYTNRLQIVQKQLNFEKNEWFYGDSYHKRKSERNKRRQNDRDNEICPPDDWKLNRLWKEWTY